MGYEIDFSDDFDFYLNEIIAQGQRWYGYSEYKFLFYHFNDLRLGLNEDAYKIRHTIV